MHTSISIKQSHIAQNNGRTGYLKGKYSMLFPSMMRHGSSIVHNSSCHRPIVSASDSKSPCLKVLSETTSLNHVLAAFWRRRKGEWWWTFLWVICFHLEKDWNIWGNQMLMGGNTKYRSSVRRPTNDNGVQLQRSIHFSYSRLSSNCSALRV